MGAESGHNERKPVKHDKYTRELEHALDESLKLQAHYAKLLNDYDGGRRRIFNTRQIWMDRLKETGASPIVIQIHEDLTS